jgi:hypothetical protein
MAGQGWDKMGVGPVACVGASPALEGQDAWSIPIMLRGQRSLGGELLPSMCSQPGSAG